MTLTPHHGHPSNMTMHYDHPSWPPIHHDPSPWSSINHDPPPWSFIHHDPSLWSSIYHDPPPWSSIHHDHPSWPIYHNIPLPSSNGYTQAYFFIGFSLTNIKHLQQYPLSLVDCGHTDFCLDILMVGPSMASTLHSGPFRLDHPLSP